MSNPISDYMREIGAKGGKAGKGNPKRAKLNSEAAKARWAKRKAKAKST